MGKLGLCGSCELLRGSCHLHHLLVPVGCLDQLWDGGSLLHRHLDSLQGHLPIWLLDCYLDIGGLLPPSSCSCCGHVHHLGLLDVLWGSCGTSRQLNELLLLLLLLEPHSC